MRVENGRRSCNIEAYLRMRCLSPGMQAGNPAQCDTAKAARL